MGSSVQSLTDRLRGLTREQIISLPDSLRRDAARLVTGQREDYLDNLMGQRTASFDAGPLLWLTKYTATENPKYESQGLPFIGPFPAKGYFLPLFNAFLSEERMFVPKTRDMLTSLSMVGYATFQAQWHKWDCLIQTNTLDKAKALVKYSANFYNFQADFLKARHPLQTNDPLVCELTWRGGGRVKAIPSGEHAIRTWHPALVLFDECAFAEEFQQSWDAACVAYQRIGISTAHPGFFAEECAI
jgi:hypothetical protein